MVRLAATSVRSHRQLPMTLFRIGASFRDEERPHRGLIDSREYMAAEACAIAADAVGIEKAGRTLREAVERDSPRLEMIWRYRLGLLLCEQGELEGAEAELRRGDLRRARRRSAPGGAPLRATMQSVRVAGVACPSARAPRSVPR